MSRRSDELKQQNNTLAQHLEDATASAAKLQARRAAAGDASEGNGHDTDALEAIEASHTSSVTQLREVVGYLRREKDILELQLGISAQEAARLRQQLEFTSRTLEESRQALQEESHYAQDSLACSPRV